MHFWINCNFTVSYKGMQNWYVYIYICHVYIYIYIYMVFLEGWSYNIHLEAICLVSHSNWFIGFCVIWTLWSKWDFLSYILTNNTIYLFIYLFILRYHCFCLFFILLILFLFYYFFLLFFFLFLLFLFIIHLFYSFVLVVLVHLSILFYCRLLVL